MPAPVSVARVMMFVQASLAAVQAAGLLLFTVMTMAMLGSAGGNVTPRVILAVTTTAMFAAIGAYGYLMFHFAVRLASRRNGVRIGAVTMEVITVVFGAASTLIALVHIARAAGILSVAIPMETVLTVAVSGVALYGLLAREAREYFAAR